MSLDDKICDVLDVLLAPENNGCRSLVLELEIEQAVFNKLKLSTTAKEKKKNITPE